MANSGGSRTRLVYNRAVGPQSCALWRFDPGVASRRFDCVYTHTQGPAASTNRQMRRSATSHSRVHELATAPRRSRLLCRLFHVRLIHGGSRTRLVYNRGVGPQSCALWRFDPGVASRRSDCVYTHTQGPATSTDPVSRRSATAHLRVHGLATAPEGPAIESALFLWPIRARVEPDLSVSEAAPRRQASGGTAIRARLGLAKFAPRRAARPPAPMTPTSYMHLVSANVRPRAITGLHQHYLHRHHRDHHRLRRHHRPQVGKALLHHPCASAGATTCSPSRRRRRRRRRQRRRDPSASVIWYASTIMPKCWSGVIPRRTIDRAPAAGNPAEPASAPTASRSRRTSRHAPAPRDRRKSFLLGLGRKTGSHRRAALERVRADRKADHAPANCFPSVRLRHKPLEILNASGIRSRNTRIHASEYPGRLSSVRLALGKRQSAESLYPRAFRRSSNCQERRDTGTFSDSQSL